MPGTVLGTGDTAGNETDPVPVLGELTADILVGGRLLVKI